MRPRPLSPFHALANAVIRDGRRLSAEARLRHRRRLALALHRRACWRHYRAALELTRMDLTDAARSAAAAAFMPAVARTRTRCVRLGVRSSALFDADHQALTRAEADFRLSLDLDDADTGPGAAQALLARFRGDARPWPRLDP